MNPKVSVIIPTYNRYNFLREAVETVINQDYENIEIIIVDDGSTDQTHKITEKFKQIKYFYQENRGVSSARNVGIKKSTGKYIAFLDSDDLWEKSKISEEVSFLEKNQEIMIVHTDEKWYRNNKYINQKKIHRKFGGDLFERSLQLCIISPSSVMIRRELFDIVGFFDESLPAAEDYDLWLRITSKFEVGYINKKLTVKRGGHNDQLSVTTFAIDRYRVISMLKLLEDGSLNEKQYDLVYSEIKRKCSILMQGAIKHNNPEILRFCDSVKEKMGNILENNENLF